MSLHRSLPTDQKDLGLRYHDLDHHDKQHYEGALRLFDFSMDRKTGVVTAGNRIRDALSKDACHMGTRMFLEFAHRYVAVFVVRDRDLRDIIRDCGFCLAFIAHWHKWVTESPVANCKMNFLTQETRVDVIVSLNSLVLAICLFRECWPGVMLQPSRLSSRYAEYVFQWLRAGGTHDKVSALSALCKLNTHNSILECQALGADLPVMQGKRGMVKGLDRMESSWATVAPPGFYPSDEEVVHCLDAGLCELEEMMQQVLDNGSTTYCMWDSVKKDGCDGAKLLAAHLLRDSSKFSGNLDWHEEGPGVGDGVGTCEAEDDDMYDHDPVEQDTPGISTEMAGYLAGTSRVGTGTRVGGVSEDIDSDDDIPLSELVQRGRSALQAHKLAAEAAAAQQATERSKAEQELSKAQAQLAHILKNVHGEDEVGDIAVLAKQVREACAQINSAWAGHGADRSARFLPKVIRDKSNMVDEEEDHYEDDDIVALLYQGKGRGAPRIDVWYAVIVKCYTQASSGSYDNIHTLHVDDAKGRVVLTHLDPVCDDVGQHMRVGKHGCLAFRRPIASQYGYNELVTTDNIACVVNMELDTEGNYLLSTADETTVDKCVLDMLKTGGVKHSLKPKGWRRRVNEQARKRQKCKG